MNKSTTNSQRYIRLLQWLRQERIERKLSVRDLAERIDEPFQFVSKVENNERRLNVYEYVQYCEALGVDPQEGIQLLKAAKQRTPNSSTMRGKKLFDAGSSPDD